MNFDRLNSLTKYPSILTYHTIGERGRLVDSEPQISFAGEHIVATEKVDGTNARIILFNGIDYVIGGREELLYAKGDRIVNPANEIAPTLIEVANRLITIAPVPGVMVIWGEVYGYRVGSRGRQYAGVSATPNGFRVFDAALFTDADELMTWEPHALAGWRDRGGQPFFSEDDLAYFSKGSGIPLTPRIHIDRVPTTLVETLDWLNDVVPATNVPLDAQAGNRSEGVVVRTPDRSKIAKIRFEDYERSLRGK